MLHNDRYSAIASLAQQGVTIQIRNVILSAAKDLFFFVILGLVPRILRCSGQARA